MDLGLDKFKNVFKKFGILTDYSSLVIPVVICVAAGLLFIPTSLLSSSLKKQVEQQSIGSGASKIQSLLADAVSSEQFKVEKEYQDKYSQDANLMTLFVKQSSQRELLSYKLFPEPNDKSMLVFKEFGNNFRNKIDEYFKMLKAGDCPTDAEIELANDKVSGDSRSSEFENEVIRALVHEKASNLAVYGHPYDLPGYTLWDNYNNSELDSAVMDAWYSQMALWIYEDIFKTIGKMNSQSSNVSSSPVKRLLFVSFPGSSQNESSDLSVEDSLPVCVTSAENAIIPSFTGRYSNSDIDVVHFQLAVILESKSIMPFIKELCGVKEHKFYGFKGTEPEKVFKHSQITVLANKADLLNKKDEDHALYEYGGADVVKLDLICEYVFVVGGYKDVKPGDKKDMPLEKNDGKKSKEARKNVSL